MSLHNLIQFFDHFPTMADVNELYGSCSCERNKYTVIIPTDSTSLAHVFFDNSVENRSLTYSAVKETLY